MKLLVILGVIAGVLFVIYVFPVLLDVAMAPLQDRMDAAAEPRPPVSMPDTKASEEEVKERYWSAD